MIIVISVVITIHGISTGSLAAGTGRWFSHGRDGWSLGRNQCGAILRLDEAVPGQFAGARGKSGLGANREKSAEVTEVLDELS